MTADDSICSICRNTKKWHDENQPQHRFVEMDEAKGTDQLKPKKRQAEPRVAPASGDPVLRIALIRAGVIKQEDLILIEEELRAARASGGLVFADPGQEGQGGTAGPVTPGYGLGTTQPDRSGGEDPVAGDRGST